MGIRCLVSIHDLNELHELDLARAIHVHFQQEVRELFVAHFHSHSAVTGGRLRRETSMMASSAGACCPRRRGPLVPTCRPHNNFGNSARSCAGVWRHGRRSPGRTAQTRPVGLSDSKMVKKEGNQKITGCKKKEIKNLKKMMSRIKTQGAVVMS